MMDMDRIGSDRVEWYDGWMDRRNDDDDGIGNGID